MQNNTIIQNIIAIVKPNILIPYINTNNVHAANQIWTVLSNIFIQYK